MKNLRTISLCATSAMLAFSLTGCTIEAKTTDESTLAADSMAQSESTPEEQAKEPERVNAGEQFTIPGMFEVTLQNFEWQDEIVVGNEFFSMTLGEAEADSSYLVINATVKNIGTAEEMLGSSDTFTHLSGAFKINDAYEINADATVILDGESTGTSSTIDPLKSEHVIFYASVSDEIKAMFEDCELTLVARQPGEDGTWYADAEPVGEYIAKFE